MSRIQSCLGLRPNVDGTSIFWHGLSAGRASGEILGTQHPEPRSGTDLARPHIGRHELCIRHGPVRAVNSEKSYSWLQSDYSQSNVGILFGAASGFEVGVSCGIMMSITCFSALHTRQGTPRDLSSFSFTD